MHVDSFKEKNISDNGPIVLTLEDTFFLFKLLYCLLGLYFMEPLCRFCSLGVVLARSRISQQHSRLVWLIQGC